MMGRIFRDESGVALGLAVILVFLLGVLAAGLLAVVRSDLESVVSANRGQGAFGLADAGAQAGAAQLRSDANPEHYDADGADNADWAGVSPDGVPGKTLALERGTARVSVLYLLPAQTPGEQLDELHAPELVPSGLQDYPDRDFFLVASEGSVGGTRRKVEAILYAEKSGDPREVHRWSWREVYE